MNPELAEILAALPPYEGHEAAAPMLPRQCYTSPAFFEFEREAVFARNWVCVGRADQLPAPGDSFSAAVAGERLLIVRSVAGDIRAMSAVCRHRGHVLSCGGDNPKGLFRCPLHFWTYDLDGRLVGAPDDLHPKNPIDLVSALKAPVLGLYGAADTGIPVASVEKMQAALDRLFDVLYGYCFRGIMADPAGSPQKNHPGRNFFRQNHRIVTRAAYHPMRLAPCLADCMFYLRNEERIHRDCLLV